jgi:hypothetical protein
MASDTDPGSMRALSDSFPLPDRAVEPAVELVDVRRDTIDRWSAAFARGDTDEVARLVRQSRTDHVWLAASGQLGPMLG